MGKVRPHIARKVMLHKECKGMAYIAHKVIPPGECKVMPHLAHEVRPHKVSNTSRLQTEVGKRGGFKLQQFTNIVWETLRFQTPAVYKHSLGNAEVSNTSSLQT